MVRTPLMAASALVAGLLVTAAPGRAQEFPYCSIPGFAVGQDCSFSSLEQCRTAVRGLGTDCERNPRYTGSAVVAPAPGLVGTPPQPTQTPQRRQTKSAPGTKS